MFIDKNGFFAIAQLNLDVRSLVSLNGSTLRLHFVYSTPTSERDTEWELLLKDHIRVLNSACRRSEYQRFREESYKHYLNKLTNHFIRIKRFLEKYDSIRDWERKLAGVREDFDRLDMGILSR